jgi:hypothetical protein
MLLLPHTTPANPAHRLSLLVSFSFVLTNPHHSCFFYLQVLFSLFLIAAAFLMSLTLILDSSKLIFSSSLKQRWARNFFQSRQIANPQILGIISLPQIHKCLWCVSPQITKPQIFFINPQIAKYFTLMSQNSAKSRLFKRFLLCTNLNWSIVWYICKEKKYVFSALRKF